MDYAMQVQRQVDDLNAVIRFLARRDLAELTEAALASCTQARQADLLILLGGITTPAVAEQVAQAWRSGLARELMVVGGQGHSTQNLRDNIAAHQRYGFVATAGRTEADMLCDILTDHLGVPRERILIERASTNCGNNAALALDVVRAARRVPGLAIIVMDPIMQRRTGEAFRHHWQAEPTRLVNYAPFIPALRVSAGERAFADPLHASYYRMESFLRLVMGEIPRLRDDEQGYGPRGRGYIGHVDIPDDVEQAFARLLLVFSEHVRPRLAFGSTYT